MKVGIVLGTTREGRQSAKEAKWVLNALKQFEDVEAEIIDLADYPMPFFSEPISPRYNQNRQILPEVQKFLDKMAEPDAYVFVTPEYNHSIPAVLKNAFDYMTFEMERKPAAIVSHGTVGGARAAMHLKEIISEAHAVPIPLFVAFAHMSDAIDEEGNLREELKQNPYGPQTTLQNMLEELVWYAQALARARRVTLDLETADTKTSA